VKQIFVVFCMMGTEYVGMLGLIYTEHPTNDNQWEVIETFPGGISMLLMQAARSGSDPLAIRLRYKQYSWSNDQYVDSSVIVLQTLNRSRRQKIRHTFPNSGARFTSTLM